MIKQAAFRAVDFDANLATARAALAAPRRDELQDRAFISLRNLNWEKNIESALRQPL